MIDVQVFTREGIERDKRAQSIIDDELRRYRQDLNDQLRIVDVDERQALRVDHLRQLVEEDLAAGRRGDIKAFLMDAAPRSLQEIGYLLGAAGDEFA